MKTLRAIAQLVGLWLLLTAALAAGAMLMARFDVLCGDAPIYRSQQ